MKHLKYVLPVLLVLVVLVEAAGWSQPVPGTVVHYRYYHRAWSPIRAVVQTDQGELEVPVEREAVDDFPPNTMVEVWVFRGRLTGRLSVRGMQK